MKEMLKKIIAEGWEFHPNCIPRGKVPAELGKTGNSVAFIGPRRAGKSYSAFELLGMIFGTGHATNEKEWLYINFEDERLAGFKRQDFDKVLEAHYELGGKKPALFLDELQNITGWDSYIRRLADAGYKVIVSGSNSKMLSSEIAGRLGGRFIQITVYPLDFKEFLKFKGVSISQQSGYSSERFGIMQYFDEYLHFGGFPEIALLSSKDAKGKVLETYFNLVFYKDLLARRNLENEEALRFMIKKLREGIGKQITPRSLHSSMLKAGISTAPNTAEKYVRYLEEAFLAIPCLPFAKSVMKQERKKRYLADNGYIKIFEMKEDLGLLLENLVFMELVKKGRQAAYHQGKRECDFIVDRKEALQAAYEINDGNLEREAGGLLEAMDAYKLQKGAIITHSQEKELDFQGRKIRVIPAWKWCLGL